MSVDERFKTIVSASSAPSAVNLLPCIARIMSPKTLFRDKIAHAAREQPPLTAPCIEHPAPLLTPLTAARTPNGQSGHPHGGSQMPNSLPDLTLHQRVHRVLSNARAQHVRSVHLPANGRPQCEDHGLSSLQNPRRLAVTIAGFQRFEPVEPPAIVATPANRPHTPLATPAPGI